MVPNYESLGKAKRHVADGRGSDDADREVIGE
jgi:hypothetical protein